MKFQKFYDNLDLVANKLSRLKVNQFYNSIGSNIFLGFGKEIEVAMPNGSVDKRKEWVIWIGDASWRVAKNGKFVVGSGDYREDIRHYLSIFENKKFLSYQVKSQFFDLQFNFEDDISLETFLSWKGDNQWAIFLPTLNEIISDCSTQKEIETMIMLSSKHDINNEMSPINLALGTLVVKEFTQHENGVFKIDFEENATITLRGCTWRVEKNKKYYVGSVDDDDPQEFKEMLSYIKGKKLKEINTSKSLMDASFLFESGYLLKIFSVCRRELQWEICSDNAQIYSTVIPIF